MRSSGGGIDGDRFIGGGVFSCGGEIDPGPEGTPYDDAGADVTGDKADPGVRGAGGICGARCDGSVDDASDGGADAGCAATEWSGGGDCDASRDYRLRRCETGGGSGVDCRLCVLRGPSYAERQSTPDPRLSL